MTSDKVHVSGDDALVIASVIIIASLRGKARPMSTVVDKKHVTGIGRSDQVGDGPADVFPGGLSVGVVGVDQNLDVILGKTVAIDEAGVHAIHVVNAALEFGLGAWVVAANQHRFLRHFSIVKLNTALSLCNVIICLSLCMTLLIICVSSDRLAGEEGHGYNCLL